MTVGHGSSDEGANGTAEQHRCDSKARRRRPGAKSVREGVDGPVDDAAVEAEEKTADGGNRAERHDVGRARPGGLNYRRRARGLQYAGGHVRRFLFRQRCTSQKLIPTWNPATNASGIRPVPPGRMMYWRSGWKKSAS